MNTRGVAKRHLERANGNIDGALEHLAEVAQEYQALHPEVSEPIEVVATMLITAQEAIKQIDTLI